jgi:hypothetical protein
MNISNRMDLFQRALYHSHGLFPGPGYYTGLEFYSHEERANTPTLEASEFLLKPAQGRASTQ